ncbi:hypothetical protein [Robiginitalea sp. SC105]|uniref:hypothetical protein n=1 Tax=Robiginitalea sp. SC105 TaxID=2762332 RepID=UPI00163B58DA|nr:hypothetical protein [Robiginitalea sp. SC105]MBC2839265.1 hypothetical protein [Robiginitalea sp. SC105]
MKRVLGICMGIGLLLFVGSCYYDQELPQAPIDNLPDDIVISFADDIEPLFSRANKNCTQCHNGLIQDPDLRVGQAYAALQQGGYIQAGNAEGSLFYQRLPGVGHRIQISFELTPEEIQLIKTWIDRGAENN